MKKTLRFLSLFLAIVMIFTCLPAISAERVSAATKSAEPCYNGKVCIEIQVSIVISDVRNPP